MIAGSTRGRGGAALVKHLLSERDQVSRPLEPRGLVSESFSDQVAELVAAASHGRTDRPLYHMHVDPPPGFEDDKIFDRYLELFEAEFRLENQARVGVEHVKNGRRHRHYAWSLVKADGKIIDLSHDYARREKISRIVEFESGMPLTPGRHNRAVIAALEAERPEVAAALKAAGLDTMTRPVAQTTPTERHQAEATGVDKADVARIAFEAWQAGRDAKTFGAELEARGLMLAEGDKGPVLVDAAGGAHSLTRMIGAESKRAGDRIKAAEVKKRVAGLALETVAIVRTRIRIPAPAPIAAPAPAPISAPAPAPIPAPAPKPSTAEGLKGRIGAWKRRQEMKEAGDLDTRLQDARKELARRQAILKKYVIARKRYNEAWKKHWEDKPSKLNYLAYKKWHDEARRIDRERKGLGRQLARLNPAIKAARDEVAAAQARIEGEVEKLKPRF